MSKLEDWIPTLSRRDKPNIESDISDTKIYLEVSRDHVKTMQKILRRTNNPELEKIMETELESAIADVAGYEKDLDDLRTVQQWWDHKFMEE